MNWSEQQSSDQFPLVHPPHFSRLFKSTYGLAPRDYRAKALTKWRTGAM
jgi:AraC-like DNA-binding protein